MINIYTSCT